MRERGLPKTRHRLSLIIATFASIERLTHVVRETAVSVALSQPMVNANGIGQARGRVGFEILRSRS